MGVIPKNIVVGFNERKETYTGKLGYVCYYKGKNNDVVHQTSLVTWADKNIPYLKFENIPTEGFVLNQKVGGANYGWNGRTVKARVYDQVRDFEFEIDMENLLYILENTNTHKGKALEGEFVYAWMGSGSVFLLPVNSPAYKEHYKKIDDLEQKKTITAIKKKDLVVGKTYINRKNQTILYCGKNYEKFGLDEYTVISKNDTDGKYIVDGYKAKSTAMLYEVCVGEISYHIDIKKIPNDIIEAFISNDNKLKEITIEYQPVKQSDNRWYWSRENHLNQILVDELTDDEIEEFKDVNTKIIFETLNVVGIYSNYHYYYSEQTKSFHYVDSYIFGRETSNRPPYFSNEQLRELRNNNNRLTLFKFKEIKL